jgi:hypothetical protein
MLCAVCLRDPKFFPICFNLRRSGPSGEFDISAVFGVPIVNDSERGMSGRAMYRQIRGNAVLQYSVNYIAESSIVRVFQRLI